MDVEVVNSAPSCPHGPTLLFTAEKGKKGLDKYFACSACRDRKMCPFFLREHQAKEKYQFYLELFEENLLKEPRIINKAASLLQVKPKMRAYCHTCSLLLHIGDASSHNEHDIQKGLLDVVLKQPSRLLKPLDNDKKEAQYFFSKASLQFVVDVLLKMGYQNFLCLGTPKIAEAIRDRNGDSSAFLLDIDRRFEQFYDESEYGYYNMFNNCFFYQSSKESVKLFLSKPGPSIVMLDPPFGGMVKPLAASLRQLASLGGEEELPFVWFSPHFLGSHITENFPATSMLDYVVEYQNHPKFWQKGSPIRMFTNIDASKIVLPKEMGFWFCEPCQRYSGPSNKHCNICKMCTAKNGQPSRHCHKCKKCVKGTFVHCKSCRRCHKPDGCAEENAPIKRKNPFSNVSKKLKKRKS